MNDIVNAVSGAAVITISIPALYAGWKLFCSVKEKLKKEFQNGMSRELKIINEKLEKKSELSHELVCGVILKTIDKRLSDGDKKFDKILDKFDSFEQRIIKHLNK